MKRNLWLKNDRRKMEQESTQANFISMRNKVIKQKAYIEGLYLGHEDADGYKMAMLIIEKVLGLLDEVESGKFTEDEIREKVLKATLALSLFRKQNEEKSVRQEGPEST
jgi:hypothetical protein